MPTNELEARLDALESESAIRRLIADYGHAFDNQDADLLRSIWHEDAHFDLGPDFGVFDGIEDIVAGAGPIWANIPKQHHWHANLSIDIDGDTASAQVALDCFVTATEAGPSMVGGQYFDKFERRDGVWKFVDRKFELAYFTPISNWTPVMGREMASADAAAA